jgi:hypothetical protein
LSDANANGRGRVQYSHQNDSLDLYSAAVPRLNIANNGDISFYEDTGTTPKFFWDASAESLGIGTASPATKLHVADASDSNAQIRINGSTSTVYSRLYSDNNGVLAISTDVGNQVAGSYMMFEVKGTERMRIDASGNVHIGAGTASTANLSIITSGQAGGIQLNRNTSGSPTSGQSLGSYAFKGLDSANSNAAAEAMIEAVAAETHTGSTAATNMIFYTKGTGTGPGSAPTPQMTLDASGNLLVGTTSQINTTKTSISASSTTNGLGIQNANDSNYLITALNSSSVEVFRVAGTGDVTNTNNSYGSLSDERLKSNIVDASSQIDDIMAVQVRSYTLDSTGETHIGVVAQELESSGMSGLVSEDKDGMKSVKYSVLYMKALKALQEAMDRIETLEAKVAALES